MSVNDLANVLKGLQTNPSSLSDLVYGTVIKVSPLTIQINARMILTSEFLELSNAVKPYFIDIPTIGKVEVFRALKVGDKVRMLRVQEGQKYYVIERE